MRINSIRWHLPISYAALALICVLALGILLMTALGRYYANLEWQYLQDNLTTLSTTAQSLLEDDAPPAEVQAQIFSFAFLSQIQIILADASDEVIADSGLPIDDTFVSFSADERQDITQPNNATEEDYRLLQRLIIADAEDVSLDNIRASIDMPVGIETMQQDSVTYYTPVITLDFVRIAPESNLVNFETSPPRNNSSSLPINRSLFGFGLNDDLNETTGRSDQMIEQDIFDTDGNYLGHVQVLNGPAYGRQIVSQVGRILITVSVIAVIFAGVIGYIISRRITVPLSIMTTVTKQMAEGGLNLRMAMNSR